MFSNVKLQFPTSTEFQLEESYLMIRITKNSISVFKYKLLMKHVIFLQQNMDMDTKSTLVWIVVIVQSLSCVHHIAAS